VSRTFTPPPPDRPEAASPPGGGAAVARLDGPAALLAALFGTTLLSIVALAIISGVGVDTPTRTRAASRSR